MCAEEERGKGNVPGDFADQVTDEGGALGDSALGAADAGGRGDGGGLLLVPNGMLAACP